MDAPNSLKHSNRILWMKHQDGIHGWNRWEDMFEGTLKKHFDIHPNTIRKNVAQRVATPASIPAQPAAASPPRHVGHDTGVGNSDRHARPQENFSQVELDVYAREHGLKIEDLRKLNGNLWVRTGDSDLQVNKALLDWGFRYKPGKGWWR